MLCTNLPEFSAGMAKLAVAGLLGDVNLVLTTNLSDSWVDLVASTLGEIRDQTQRRFTLVSIDMQRGTVAEVELPAVRRVRIQAEDCTPDRSTYSTKTVGDAGSEGGLYLGYIKDGEYVGCPAASFGSGGQRTFSARVASATQGGSIVVVDLGIDVSKTIAVCEVPGTGGWLNWRTVSCRVDGDLGGSETILLSFTGGTGYLYNIDWIEFGP